jgi:hypothetical protein
MSPARLDGSRRLASGLWAAVARTADDERIGLLLPREPADPLPASDLEPLPLPASWSTDDGLEALTRWCAERLALAARIQIGAVVLLRSDPPLGPALVDAVRAMGGLVVSEGSSLDRAVLTGSACAGLADVLARCRNGALVVISAVGGQDTTINLYPDVHRRGVEVAALRLDLPDPDGWLRHRERAVRIA